MYLGDAVLRSLPMLPTAIAELLGAFPYDFLYGSIAADTSIAKKYAAVGRHSHSWTVGFDILDRARDDALKAFSYGYLAHLAAEGEATIGDVHRAFAHKRSTLTSILDRLERRGLIQRISDPRDRRTFVIRLTRRGRVLARRVTAHLEAFEKRALARLPARDVKAFTSVLEALEHAFEEE